MEEDDEFGDLYSFPSSAPPPSFHRPIDLHLKTYNTAIPPPPSNHHLVIDLPTQPNRPLAASSARNSTGGDLAAGFGVLGGGGAKVSEDASYGGKGHGHQKDGDLMDKDIKFDIEDGNNGIDDMDSNPIIPGLSTGGGGDVFGGGSLEGKVNWSNLGQNGDASGTGVEGDDWDSDSEDDLQIVLNDNNHGPMAMERAGVAGEAENEDGDPLVIVADGDANQAMEEEPWGEDGHQAADGERKEIGEAGKPNGGMVIAPKVGYTTHGYHPFHSQFKYVRPGATQIPGSNIPVPGGAPGQVRPHLNISPIAGRGRGDWRPTGNKNGPPMQKPAWGAGRGFGGGLEFTLPSHKTIFEVDVDSFEDKPWKYPGIDISDFFNFGLNEESWKVYCKHLEQLRLESTMQSKICVYESGRTEQDYDPDLPPELAAATGGHDVATDNANIGKSDAGQHDFAKGSARIRPPLPTGRAIQVEGGYGERLPSIDTRPPRVRDSDAIIEIVCQDSMDDDSSTVVEQPGNDPSREDFGGREAEEVAPLENEYFNGYPQTYNNKKRDLVGRRMPFRNAVWEEMPEGDRVSPLPLDRSPGSLHEERQKQVRGRDRSPPTTDKKFFDNQKEESVESMDSKHSQRLSSPVAEELPEDSDIHKDAMPDDQVLANGNSEIEKETSETKITNETGKDGNLLKKQKMSTRAKLLLEERGEDFKAARSTENSKARSGSSKDSDNWRDGIDEEVIQDGQGSHMGSIKHLDDEKSFRRKDVGGRQGVERNHMVAKGREDPYSQRDWSPRLGNHLHVINESSDVRKEKENPDGTWQRRDDNPQIRRVRAEDTRKREHGKDIGPRHRSKVRESERSDKDEYLNARKQLDNGSYRVPYDNDFGSRHREKDENLKSRYKNADEYHIKRRKDEEYVRREQDKEETSHGHRENSSRRKREMDDVVDQRKRDDQPGIKNKLDDNHSVRHKDEGGVRRERTERQREKEDWHQKQSHEENLSKREQDKRRSTSRSGRGAEEKAWAGHARAKDEYKSSDKEHHLKETAHQTEQLKRRDRMNDEGLSHHRGSDNVHMRGNQLISSDKRRSGQEKSSSHNDCAVNVSDNQRVRERKNEDNTKKNKESEGGNQHTSKRYQEDKSSHGNETGMKGVNGRGNSEREIQVRHSSRKHKEDASSDDEQQESKRGRSKLERWTSHKEMDFIISSKSASSSKLKEIDANQNGGLSEGVKILEVSTKTANQPISAEEKDITEDEIKESDKKPLDDRHLDTVEKLKKRSERFKLPLLIEKETSAIERVESEALPTTRTEAPAGDSEIKPERPARKRRWISQ